MSARGADGRPRFVEVCAQVIKGLESREENERVRLVTVPGREERTVRRDDVLSTVTALKRTAAETGEALRAAVRQWEGRGGVIIVVSDQDLGSVGAEVIAARPKAGVRDAGIVGLAERPGQVMVALAGTEATSRTLVIDSGGAVVRREVKIGAGEGQKVFVDLDPRGDTIEARLEGTDDFDANDRAWLVRQRSWPAIETRAAVSDELRRMIEVYGRNRPAGEGSVRLAIARSGELKVEEAGVVLAPVAGQVEAGATVQASAHPATRDVDWSSLGRGASVSATGPGEGWTVAVRLGGRPILAVRDAPARQVWVGFESRAFARTPAFVVFWTNVFDWVGAGSEGFEAGRVGDPSAKGKRLLPEGLPDGVEDRLWPGVFETGNGKVALNAGGVTFAGGPDDWTERIAKMPERGGDGRGVALGPWLALVALGCLGVAAGRWERRRTPRLPSQPVHLEVETIRHVERVMAADGHAHRHETRTPPE
jgi:hypothetical protein